MITLGICGKSIEQALNPFEYGYEVDRLIEEGKKIFDEVIVIKTNEIQYHFERGSKKPKVLYRDRDLSTLSALIVRGTAGFESAITILAKSLDLCGTYIFDSIDRFTGASPSKLYTTVERFANGVGSSSYLLFSAEQAVSFLGNFGTNKYPLLAKPIRGTRGVGIILLENESGAVKFCKSFFLKQNNEPLLIQQYIKIKNEYRAFIVGGECIGLAEKFSATDKIAANAGQGGVFEKATDSEIVKFAIKNISTHEVIGADIARTVNNELHVIEANYSPQWKAFEKATNVNVAKNILEYGKTRILKRTEKVAYQKELSNMEEPWCNFTMDKPFVSSFEGYPKEYNIIKKILLEYYSYPIIDLSSIPVIISPLLWETVTGKKREDIMQINQLDTCISDIDYERFKLFKKNKNTINVEILHHDAFINGLKNKANIYSLTRNDFINSIQRRLNSLEQMIDQIKSKKWKNLFFVTPNIGEKLKDKDTSYTISTIWETSIILNEGKNKGSGTFTFFSEETSQSQRRFLQRWHEVKSEHAKGRDDWPIGLNSANDIPLFVEDCIDFNINSVDIVKQLLLGLKNEISEGLILEKNSVKVFISYSHEDEKSKDNLEEHLSGLRSEGVIDSWTDKEILAGQNWDAKIKEEINGADIILLLVSSSFMSSEYIKDVELQNAFQRHDKKEALVIPIIIRPCDYSSLTEIKKLQALPQNAKAISKWSDKDEAFLGVVSQLKKVILNIDTLVPNRNKANIIS